jgi:hypothetical protein
MHPNLKTYFLDAYFKKWNMEELKMPKYSLHNYEVKKINAEKYIFIIYTSNGWIDSDEWHESQEEAHEEAKKRINRLENGEG